MELPVIYPTDETNLLEEVARFRALSPSEQCRELDEWYGFTLWLETRSPEFDERLAVHQQQGHEAIKAFIARHHEMVINDECTIVLKN